MHSSERSTVSYPQRRRTPSFSSSLLESITNSLDDSKSHLQSDPKHSNFTRSNENHGKNRERMNLRRSLMMEDWMEKQSTNSRSSHFTKSSSSSSECSSGEAFFSSETDTTTTTRSKKQRSRPKSEKPQKPQRDCGFAKTTKLRALKIYGELEQRVKQPISPASRNRIAAFLSSIFSSQNVKKAKMCYVGAAAPAAEDVRFEHKSNSKSPCFYSSSVSSFSMRSCMTKTPSSSSNSAKGNNKANSNNNGVKRCVRFYLGEDDSEPRDPTLFPVPCFRKELKSNEAKEDGLNNLKGYRNPSGKLEFGEFYDGNGDDDEMDEEEDGDAMSCSSSDLFELDHLINGRYQQELPVYETTNLERNKAIANGLRL